MADSAPAASAPSLMLISEATVESSITMREAVHINAQAFIAAYEQTAVLPTYNRILEPVPYDANETRATLFKPAQVGDALGMKVVAIRATNTRLGLPTVPGVIMLNDRDTGFPIALVQATYLTAFRTAAGCGAATDMAAKRDASVLASFGAGMQAREHIKAMLCVRPTITKVHIINRSASRALELAHHFAPLYPAVSFEVHALGDASAAAAIEAAVKSSHIICTTTNSNEPLVSLSMVSPGTHINAVGSYLPHMHELSSELVAACRIAIDLETADHAGDLRTPIVAGLVRREDLVHIGSYLPREKYEKKLDGTVGADLVSPPADKPRASVPWRRTDDEITLFKSVGSAVQDIVTAHAVFEACQKSQQGKIAVW